MRSLRNLILIIVLSLVFLPLNVIFADSQWMDGQLNETVSGRIVFSNFNKKDNQYDLLWVNADGQSGEVYRITDTPWNEINPTISPDGRYIAYASDKSGSWRIEILELEAPNVAASVKELTTRGNSLNPQWVWNAKFFKEETLDPNGIIAYESDITGDWGIYAKYPQNITAPAMVIKNNVGVDERKISFFEKGTPDVGRFKNEYIYTWEVPNDNSSGSIINFAVLPSDDFYPEEEDECNINRYHEHPKCYQDLRGSSWTFGIEGHSVSWLTGTPDSYHFPGSLQQPLFTFVRSGQTPGTTKLMWSTIPDDSLFPQERAVGELTANIYGGFEKNFAEILEHVFSPFDQQIVAHFMRDTNPLRNDKGSLKILESGDNIVARVNIPQFSSDFDWGEHNLIESIRQSGLSMEQFRGRLVGSLDENYQERYANEEERIQQELEELENLENLRIDQQAELLRKQQELAQIELDNLSKESREEIEKERERIEAERFELERQSELEIERQRLELERQQFELERERQQRELEMQNEQFQLERDNLVFSSNDRFSVYEEEKCEVTEENSRGLFGNYQIGSEIDCDFGEDLAEKFEDPTNLAMLGLIVTVGATVLQMFRGN